MSLRSRITVLAIVVSLGIATSASAQQEYTCPIYPWGFFGSYTSYYAIHCPTTSATNLDGPNNLSPLPGNCANPDPNVCILSADDTVQRNLNLRLVAFQQQGQGNAEKGKSKKNVQHPGLKKGLDKKNRHDETPSLNATPNQIKSVKKVAQILVEIKLPAIEKPILANLFMYEVTPTNPQYPAAVFAVGNEVESNGAPAAGFSIAEDAVTKKDDHAYDVVFNGQTFQLLVHKNTQ